ncbi:MAG: hypothetical protein SFV15_16540 [Polyangiaceae bacterium]|nr:hypothetical protein [Polyangiaceae bacterium]
MLTKKQCAGVRVAVLGIVSCFSFASCSSSRDAKQPERRTGTHRLLSADFKLVGTGGHEACSHEEGATGDRWCAFYKLAGTGVELWVFNVSKFLAGSSFACDGTSHACRLISSRLWTGRVGLADVHPWVHRFDGDTLIFNTETDSTHSSIYQGEIYAWRPGWSAASRLTSSRGVSCMGHHRSATVACRTEPTFEATPPSAVEQPAPKEYRIVANVLNTGEETLVDAGTVGVATGTSLGLQQQVVLSKRGKWLFLASPGATGAGGARTSDVSSIAVSDLGKNQLKPIVQQARLWLPTYDESAVYLLDGALATEDGARDLVRLDLLEEGSRRVIARHVLDYARLGSHDEFLPEKDEGVFYTEQAPGEQVVTLKLMPDSGSSIVVGTDLEKIQVSIDERHTFHLQRDGGAFPVAHVRRNDGSQGDCVLSDPSADAFGGHFSDSGKRVYWMQLSDVGLHEAWVARPDCTERQKFAPAVRQYFPIGDDLVAFTGEEKLKSPLRIAIMHPEADVPLDVQEIHESADSPTRVIRIDGAVYLVFEGFSPSQDNAGIFIHGPLELSSSSL